MESVKQHIAAAHQVRLGHRTRRLLRVPILLQRAVLKALAHDCLNLGQSAAYSAMIALFPALIVSAAAIALLPDAAPLKAQIGGFFDQVLPADVFPLLTGYFATSGSPHTTRALVLAAVVSLTGGSSVIATLMEGLRRAECATVDEWSFWQRRVRALLLVPVSLVPLLIATLLTVFGQWITLAIAAWLTPAVHGFFLGFALVIRWTISLAGVAALTGSIFHLGTAERHSWRRAVPGALVATGLWFVSTLIFGWYVTRFANYTQVYGSLGAGIALLLWLYLVFLSVLIGAEFNVQFAEHFGQHGAVIQPASGTGTATNPLG